MDKRHPIRRITPHAQPNQPPTDYSLQVLLWSIWTLTVISVGVWTWWFAAVAPPATPLIELVLRCTTAGLLGLILITRIEQRLEPWRMTDSVSRSR